VADQFAGPQLTLGGALQRVAPALGLMVAFHANS